MFYLPHLVVAAAIALITIITTALALRRYSPWAARIPGIAAVLYLGLGLIAAITAPQVAVGFILAGIAALAAAGCLYARLRLLRKTEFDGDAVFAIVGIVACTLAGLGMILAGIGGLLFWMGVR